MSISETPAEPKPPGELASDQLIGLYEKRRSQVHHLDDLDQRSLVLVVTAITGAVVSSPSAIGLSTSLQIALSALAAIICVGGIYSTVRNRVSMEFPLAAIDFIEYILNQRQVGLFPYAGNYSRPQVWEVSHAGCSSAYVVRSSYSLRQHLLLAWGVSFSVLLHL